MGSGRLTAVLGIRRADRIGLVGFAATSLTALLAPTVLALVNETFTDEAGRAKAFGALGATGGLGAAAGLIVGGAVTDAWGWRWSLFINVGISAWSDAPGLISGCGAIVCLVEGFNRAEEHSWGSTSTVSWLCAGAVLLSFFVLRERAARDPVLPLWLFREPSRVAAYATQLTAGAAQMGMIVALTFYFQDHVGFSPLETWIAFLPMVGVLVVTALMAARAMVPRWGARGMFPVGLAVQAVGFFVLSHLSVDSSYSQVALPGLMILGLGIGLAQPVTFNAGTKGVPETQAGVASEVFNAFQQIGSSFGVAITATVATRVATVYVADHRAQATSDAAAALAQAEATPDSEAGRQIVAQLTGLLADQAQIHGDDGGFVVLAWIVGVIAVLLALAGVILRAR